jgi:hypothetical protein
VRSNTAEDIWMVLSALINENVLNVDISNLHMINTARALELYSMMVMIRKGYRISGKQIIGIHICHMGKSSPNHCRS